jgi:aerobic carbon-monoxide dehydrogenase medium subunit
VKAPAFDYVRPRSLDEALSLLRQHGDGAKIIAGGQSLVPALNLRLLSPKLLVDIGALRELKGISVADGTVRIGALTRHVELQRSSEIARHAPLLVEAVAQVGHPAVRNRGTIGGNFAHADPASELPACALALQGRVVTAGPGGERRIEAEAFFTGIYETALGPGEIVVAVEVPAARRGERHAFLELSRRSGDFALVGVACRAKGDGVLSDLRLAYFGIGRKPTLATSAAAQLAGTALSAASIGAAQAALAEDLEPQDDLQASAPARLHLAQVLLRRALDCLVPDRSRQERRRA